MVLVPLACRCMAVATLVALGAGRTSAAPADDDVRRVAAEVLADTAYQRELPTSPKPRERQARSEPEPDAGPRRSAVPNVPRPREADPQEAGEWLAGLLGIAAAALVAFYAVNRFSHLAGRRGGVARWTAGTPAAASFAAPSDPLAGPDALANAGNYGQAIHAILLLVLERLRERIGFAPRPSLTSREIMARVTLAEGACAALALIVRMAELSHFGGRAPSEADYQRCREGHHRLASPAVGET
jgi:hypothetical protein